MNRSYRTPSASLLATWRKIRQRKHREKRGLFLAEGVRSVDALLRSGHLHVESILFTESKPPVEVHPGTPLYRLSDREFESVSGTENPQGIAAICRIPDAASPDDLSVGHGALLATDAIQDPGNLGTMIRTAVWFGVKGVICGSGTVDLWNPKVVRSTAGSTGLLPYTVGALEEILPRFESHGWRVILLDGSPESKPLQSVKRAGRTVVVVGNEANGIRPELFGSRRERVRIEGYPDRVESLNAAVAVGISLYRLASPEGKT